MWLAQSNPAKEFVAYSMLSSTPKLGLHPVALLKVRFAETVPVELAKASSPSKRRKAAM